MEKEKKSERWRADKYGSYWFLDSDGSIHHFHDNRTEYDDWRYDSGNYFRMRKGAEEYKEKMAVYNELKVHAEPDDTEWNGIDLHWFIAWAVDCKEIRFFNADKFKSGAKLYFPSQSAVEPP